MKIRQLDEATVKYFIGQEFRFLEVQDDYEYKDNKRTDNILGSKIIIASEENPNERFVVKVSQKKEDISVKAFEPISFEGLTGKFWLKGSEKFKTIELSLKADKVVYDFKFGK